ncbi:MAG: tetratricopeptide repeat protein [Candidatus Omnitrophota bacterium]
MVSIYNLKAAMGRISLLVLFSIVAISISGCSEQYQIERMVWQADKASKSIFFNNGEVAPYEFIQAISLYEKVIGKAPSDSNHALNSRFKIAQIYALQKEFDKAREIYDKIIVSHQGRQEVQALALFEKGQTFQKQGDWPWALGVFKKITDNYRETKQSFSVPLYIAHYYVENGDDLSAEQAYSAAIAHYQRIAQDYPGTRAAVLCENLIVRTYMEQKNWDMAVAYIKQLDSKYKLGADTLLVLAKIYENKLQEKPKAIEVYNRIVMNFSEYKEIDSIKKKLEKLKEEEI